MNKRTQTKRTTRPRKTTPAKKPYKKKNLDGFKSKINLVIIWALVVLNGVLIFSLVHKIFNMNSMHVRIDPRPEVLPEDPVTILIHNGCGVAGLAKTLQDILVRHHYDVRAVGNAPDPYDNTVIIDRGSRSDEEIEALRELMGLNKDKVVKLTRTGYSTDVKIILGKDYSSLKIYKANQ